MKQEPRFSVIEGMALWDTARFFFEVREDGRTLSVGNKFAVVVMDLPEARLLQDYLNKVIPSERAAVTQTVGQEQK